MVTKKGKRSTKSVKSLKSKGLTAKQAKSVKGGIIIIGGKPIQDKWEVPLPPSIIPQGGFRKG